jgi:hypothetical protein
MIPTRPRRGAAPPRLPPKTSIRHTLAAAALAFAAALGACDRAPTTPGLPAPDAAPSALMSASAGGYAQVSAGWSSTCAVTHAGAIVCWGSNGAGQSTPPADNTGFARVDAGNNHACALKADGSLVCWGADSGGSITPPPGTYTDVSAGDYHTCAVRTSGEVVCFGVSDHGETAAPAGTDFVAVSAGMRHSCALRAGGTLACWGLDFDGSISGAVADAGPFTSVSAGFLLTCARRSSGQTSCWGNSTFGQTTPPADANFVQMGAGNEHVCGVRVDGTVACWGNQGQSRAAAPAGTGFVQVSGGNAHSCAVKTDGSIACWGEPADGKTSPPPPPAPTNLTPIVPVTGGNNCPPGYTNNGLTCGRGTHTFAQGSRVADCPAGYTNNGATCGRSAESIPNGGSTPADCPAGYTNNGATCGRAASTIGNGGSILATCPAGFTNMGASCYRFWPPKSLGMGTMTCPDGWFRSGGRCYQNCPEGYVNTGVSCYRPPSTLPMSSMTCPAGRFKSGARCYIPCPEGYTNTGVSCYRPPSTLPMSSMTCRPDEFISGARCYMPCPVGYTNTGETCFRPASTVPRNANINWNPDLAQPRQKFYNIGHMANTPAAAKWAVDQGANGLEIDLRFNSAGTPEAFRHEGACDCGCAGSTSPDHICPCLDNSCNAGSDPSVLLRYLATLPGLALVYIDSKVDGDTPSQAGTEVIRLLERDLFGAGYQGVVIVAAPKTNSAPYLRAAVAESGTKARARRYFFGYDMVSGTLGGLEALQEIPGAPNLVYSTGFTSCFAETYFSEISTGVAQRGLVSLTGVWTVDTELNMGLYLQLGANAIVTNKPGVLRNVLAQTRPDIQLASPTDSPPLRY